MTPRYPKELIKNIKTMPRKYLRSRPDLVTFLKERSAGGQAGVMTGWLEPEPEK